MQEQPLRGIRVLDFGQVYNGPYCGFLLAQAGAQVIKVESPLGETLRARGRKTAAAYPFALLNSNKSCVTVNLKSTEGQGLIKKMVPEMDVVLENFAPGTMDKFGLGAADLRAINSRLVYAASTGYGYTGPYRDYLGMDITLQAVGGIMSVTGEEGGPPLKTPATFPDFIAGTHLYGAIVTALFARSQTGEGATVDISMQDCVFPPLATALGSYYVADGVQPSRAGNRHPGRALAPYNVYEAADGYLAIICIREGHWRKLCAAMGQPALAEDTRFATMALRCENMDALDDLVTRWTRQRTRAALFELAQAHGVICAPVNDLNDVVDDPQLIARGFLKHRAHPELGEIAQCQTPLRFRDIEPPVLTDVPDLGADNAAIFGQFADVDATELARLQACQAI